MILRESDLPFERVWYWSDSTLTLQYIRNETQRLKVFVANCVAEVLETSNPKQWQHVPGDQNPADLLTRGVSEPEKLMGNRWFTAPAFLEKDEELWPKFTIGELNSEDVEIKKKPFFTMVITAHDSEQIDFNRISTWIRLRRVAGWVIRFTENVSVKKEDRQSGELTANDLKGAEQLVLKEVQKECFQEELLKLKNGGVLPSSNRLSMLCPFVDATGLMKVGGRLNRLEIPPEVKHPVILPRTHRVTRMLVEWMHRRNGHVGPDHTLSLVRGKYWVMSGRIVVNQVLPQCFFCCVWRAK